MKSMQVTEFGQPLVQADTPTPVPRGREVLLRVRAAGVCHTDLHLWHGGYDLGHGRTLLLKERGVTLPLTMGHETVGIVEAVGEDAGEVPLGAVRLVYPWIGCGQCEVCREGRENLCLTPRTIGINRAGGYADYILVPDPRHLVDLQGLDPVRAAPLACSGLTCFSALRKIGEDVLRRGAIVVVGAGGLGLMSLQLLKAMGAPGAVVVEVDAAKREAALRAGALAAIDPKAPDAAQAIRDAVGGPVRAVLDLVANPESAALGFDLLTKGGRLVLVGLFGGAAPWPLPLIPMKSATIQGSYVGSLPELRELVALVARERLELIPVSTCGMGALGQALRDLEAGRIVGRMIMTP
ncbi:alcohol dehydrogenase [Bordetella hinzii]|uniref:alcohol dehydrogenase n=1 Tax=Bordetella hinzii TaxID=103855 RepID=A0AAN1RUX1_9BORD|nr:alcohol dehydrogenase [Bordetella hinzii]AKQ58538.1 Alcohol dehydrogenase [Bordetella hinzii]AZW16155.1 alcohol dehydrogenase [Bordetella hinzii]MBZ0074604.1 alcohol dehydrogenase catalytic domain-containing protein [Bordetella hinzii]MBZ0080550.1 alcohol dehydrogenase catalytic domain-containing protein [Bordetella hinzii]MBZ0082789.1 alcohol dehydrogenase catalytic domain-containing protein [Bordetella hinzii]